MEEIKFRTGTTILGKPKYRLESYEEKVYRRWWEFRDRYETLYRLVPDNEHAFVGLSNMDYETAIVAKATLER